MRLVSAIAANELRRLFLSPFAWMTIAATQFLMAIFFYLLLSNFLELSTSQLSTGLTSFVAIGLYQIFAWLMLLVVPIVCMRILSDELRSGTIKLLLSSPLAVWQIVIGKYLGVIAFFILLIFLISLMPLSLIPGTQLDYSLLLVSFIALVLLCATLAAIGLFVSSLSKSPAMSAISAFVVSFLLWIIHVANDSVSAQLENIITYLSLQKHFNALLSGAFSSVDFMYFLLLSSLFITLTIWRLDSLRTQE